MRTYWPLLALGAGAIAVALMSRHVIFPAYSWNRDEPVYLWQVAGLRSGQFTPTDGGAPAFFRPWLAGVRDGSFFSQYTLGWPLVLLAGDLAFGSPDAAIALGALLTVLGTYALAREITRDHALALVAAGVMLASPIVAIQSGVYLGYLFTLGLGLLFAATLLASVRTSRPVGIVGAGLMLGWIFMTRPFDAVLWGGAVVGYTVLAYRGEWRRLATSAGWLALGLTPLVVATLAYNLRVTGSLTEFPITAADPLDTFGFGRRRIMPALPAAHFDAWQSVQSSGRNGFFLPLFLAGSYLGVAVAAVGLWIRRHERSTLLLVAIMVAFPLGYFFFWGIFVSSATMTLSGPIYFIPLYAPLSILIATAIMTAWRNQRALGVALVVALVVVTIPFAVNRLQVNRNVSRAQLPWKHATRTIKDRSLVFVWRGGYLLFLNPFSVNGPDLDGRVLFATDKGASDLDLIGAHRDRTPYLERTSIPPEGVPTAFPHTPTITVTRMRVLRGDAVTLHARIRVPRGHPVVVASLQVGDRVLRRTLATDAGAGSTYDTDWVVGRAADRAPPGAVPLPTRLGSVTVAAGFGDTVAAARRHPAVRQRFGYRLVGRAVEMLLPSQKSRRGTVFGTRKWIPMEQLAALQVAPLVAGP